MNEAQKKTVDRLKSLEPDGKEPAGDGQVHGYRAPEKKSSWKAPVITGLVIVAAMALAFWLISCTERRTYFLEGDIDTLVIESCGEDCLTFADCEDIVIAELRRQSLIHEKEVWELIVAVSNCLQITPAPKAVDCIQAVIDEAARVSDP